jgi:hypothetical protein
MLTDQKNLTPDIPGMSEIQIQTKAYQHLHNNYPKIRGLLFHVPNGGGRNVIEGMQLKASGVVPGIPDLLFINDGKLHYIEVKKPGGVVSEPQIAIHAIWKLNGVEGIVAYSSKQIVDYVLNLTCLE